MGSRTGRAFLRVATGAILFFMYVPLALVVIYAFSDSGSSAWPPTSLSLKWVEIAIANTGLRDAFLTSILVALGATVIALVLGSLAALAVARHRFFGRELVSFVVIFPIALPGIVTGMGRSGMAASLGAMRTKRGA